MRGIRDDLAVFTVWDVFGDSNCVLTPGLGAFEAMLCSLFLVTGDATLGEDCPLWRVSGEACDRLSDTDAKADPSLTGADATSAWSRDFVGVVVVVGDDSPEFVVNVDIDVVDFDPLLEDAEVSFLAGMALLPAAKSVS